MKIQVGAILDGVLTDGPGRRTSVYVSGCSIRCAGCQNDQLFDATYGDAWDIQALTERLLAPGLPISILGGEPLDQIVQVSSLVSHLRRDARFVGPLILYTGYTYEKLWDRQWRGYATDARAGLWAGAFMGIQAHVDILVDGPFLGRKDDDFVQWRGSRNQRPIDLAAMRDAGDMRELIVLDWDTQTLTITDDGDILGTIGLINELTAVSGDSADDTRRCGQTKPY